MGTKDDLPPLAGQLRQAIHDGLISIGDAIRETRDAPADPDHVTAADLAAWRKVQLAIADEAARLFSESDVRGKGGDYWVARAMEVIEAKARGDAA